MIGWSERHTGFHYGYKAELISLNKWNVIIGKCKQNVQKKTYFCCQDVHLDESESEG